MEKVIGKHYAKTAVIQRNAWGHPWCNISIGICPVLPNAKGGPKLGPAVIRVSGPNTEEGVAAINKLAELVAKKLDDDAYMGPKKLSTDSYYVGNL